MIRLGFCNHSGDPWAIYHVNRLDVMDDSVYMATAMFHRPDLVHERYTTTIGADYVHLQLSGSLMPSTSIPTLKNVWQTTLNTVRRSGYEKGLEVSPGHPVEGLKYRGDVLVNPFVNGGILYGRTNANDIAFHSGSYCSQPSSYFPFC